MSLRVQGLPTVAPVVELAQLILALVFVDIVTRILVLIVLLISSPSSSGSAFSTLFMDFIAVKMALLALDWVMLVFVLAEMFYCDVLRSCCSLVASKSW